LIFLSWILYDNQLPYHLIKDTGYPEIQENTIMNRNNEIVNINTNGNQIGRVIREYNFAKSINSIFLKNSKIASKGIMIIAEIIHIMNKSPQIF